MICKCCGSTEFDINGNCAYCGSSQPNTLTGKKLISVEVGAGTSVEEARSIVMGVVKAIGKPGMSFIPVYGGIKGTVSAVNV